MKTQMLMMPYFVDKGKTVMQTDLALNNHHIRGVSRQTAKITKRLLSALHILKMEVSEKQDKVYHDLLVSFNDFWLPDTYNLIKIGSNYHVSVKVKKVGVPAPNENKFQYLKNELKYKDICTSARLYPKVTLLHALPTCNLFSSIFLVTKCLFISIELRLHQGVPFSELLLLLCRSKRVPIL